MDYTQFSEQGPSDGISNVNRRWWVDEGEQMADGISSTMLYLMQHQTARQTQYLVGARLYGNINMMGVNGISYSKLQGNQTAGKDRVSYNVVQSVIDTITSKIAKNKPRPMFLTSGGDYKQQRKAKRLNKFIDGLFYEVDAYKLGTDIFRDACVFGTGVLHIFDNDGRCGWERVLPHEIYVDDIEGFYGSPRQLHRAKAVDREVLLEEFGTEKEAAEAIATADRAKVDENQAYPNVADMVQVRESWHLPSGPKAKDGKHVISIDGCILFEEEWSHDFFPFVFFHWSKRLFGFWGQGLAEQLQSIQYEINKLLWVVQRSFHLAGTFKVLLENTSKVVPEHINNDIGAIIKYTGIKPEYVTPPAVQGEIFQHLETLKKSAYEQAGISLLSANSQKPSGLNSGKALREFNDIETERFMAVGQAYENFFVELGKISIEMVKDIARRHRGKYVVRSIDKNTVDPIDWSDISMDSDEYVMQAYPVSSLPNEPAGRMQTVTEYVQAGWLTQRQGKKLLDFPDLETADALGQAAEDHLQRVLDKIVDDGEYTPPEPYDDLALAHEMAMEVYQLGKCNDLEEDKLEMLRMFIGQVQMLITEATPPPPPAPPAAPIAGPMPVPASPLVPQAPEMGAAPVA